MPAAVRSRVRGLTRTRIPASPTSCLVPPSSQIFFSHGLITPDRVCIRYRSLNSDHIRVLNAFHWWVDAGISEPELGYVRDPGCLESGQTVRHRSRASWTNPSNSSRVVDVTCQVPWRCWWWHVRCDAWENPLGSEQGVRNLWVILCSAVLHRIDQRTEPVGNPA